MQKTLPIPWKERKTFLGLGGCPRGEGCGRGLVARRELDLRQGLVPRGTLQSELHGSQEDTGAQWGPRLPEQRRLSAGPLGTGGVRTALLLGHRPSGGGEGNPQETESPQRGRLCILNLHNPRTHHAGSRVHSGFACVLLSRI